MTDKASLRAEMRTRRSARTAEARGEASHRVCARLLAHPAVRRVWAARGTACVYLATAAELELADVVASARTAGVRLVAPRWTGRGYALAELPADEAAWVCGPMGVREPPAAASAVAPGEVSLWFVPGLAFTADGARLGYGGGWYDRLLAAAAPEAVALGVAYAFQVVGALPVEPHDRRLQAVVTDVGQPGFSVVLVHPEIPHNTGAVGRLCVGLGVRLNLVRPLGFRLDDRSVARAGLDYWPYLDLAVHDTWEAYLAAERPERLFFLSTRGERSLYGCAFRPGDALVFGSESAGLPREFYARYREALFRIPMPGAYARSINLANAVAVAAYECHRQLLAGGLRA